MIEGEDLLLCPTCGTQYDVPASEPPSGYCRICDDPRQYIPPTGQRWTSLRAEAGKHETKWKQDDHDDRVWYIWAEPKLGIGQRAILLQTAHGNVLWDCMAYLDDSLIEFITSKGGLSCIVISHPHFYTTHVAWAAAFACNVYTHALDSGWLSRGDGAATRRRVLLERDATEVLPGVTAVKVGGHFDGSMVLHWESHLFVADSFVHVPSGLYRRDRPQGTTSFSFMWSIPNMIPLPPDTILAIWKAIRPFDFTATHGLFLGWDIRDEAIKASVLESMKIQVRGQGFAVHALLDEVWQ